MQTRLSEARDLIVYELRRQDPDVPNPWPLAVERGLQRAVERGLIVEADCSCPVGFGQVRDPRCGLHGDRAPAHTITGA